MAIDSNLKIHPVSWLVGARAAGKINTDISIQRREVWDHIYKSNLIIAMLNNAPIANLCFEKEGRNNFKVIDGKQRTLTLCAFVANGFALSKNMRYNMADGVNISGMKFSELPAELQEKLLTYQLSFSILDEMDEDERDFVFFMGNQSAPLTKTDLLPVVLVENIMLEFNRMAAHPFFTERIKMGLPGRRKRDDLKVLVHYLILHSKRSMGFSGKEIISFCDDIRSGEIHVSYDKVLELMDYLCNVMTTGRAYLKLIHVPTIMYVAQQALSKQIDADLLADKFDDFFMNISEEYISACRQNAYTKHNVHLRTEMMLSILEDENV